MSSVIYLQEFIDTTSSRLEQVRRDGVKKEFSFDICCGELDDYNHVDIREAAKFKDLFDNLKGAEGPVLYWFEISSDTDTRHIIKSLNNYKVS